MDSLAAARMSFETADLVGRPVPVSSGDEEQAADVGDVGALLCCSNCLIAVSSSWLEPSRFASVIS